MFFIVWGWRGRQKEIGNGEFFCPQCRDYRGYRLVAVNRWFTLYWIPLFKTSSLGAFVECGACKGTFNEGVLKYDPKSAQEEFEAAFAVASKRVMFKKALADGEIDDAEVAQIAQAYRNIAKREIAAEDIASELEAARGDARPIGAYLAEVSPTLNDTGKELVLRAAVAVAKADGHVDDSEITELQALAQALDMPKAYANGVFAEVGIAARR